MRISVSTYSFSPLIRSGAMTQLDCILKAKELGFDGIEFADILPDDNSGREEYALRLRRESKRQGMEISSFVFGADFLSGCGGDTEAEIERVKEYIDLAGILGVKRVRHDVSSGFLPGEREYREFETVLPRLAKACREVTEYAAKKGIKTMVENHGFFCQDSSRVEKLINAVNHPNFGWLVDIGNFLCVDEDPITAIERAAPYACYVHVKDFHFKSKAEENPGEGFFPTRGGNFLRGSIIGQGCLPVKRALSILKKAGYDGGVSIEFEGMEDSLTGIGTGLSNLRRYIGEIWG